MNNITAWICSLILWGLCLGYSNDQQVDDLGEHMTLGVEYIPFAY